MSDAQADDVAMAEIHQAAERLDQVERLKGQLLIDVVDGVTGHGEAKGLLTELVVEAGELLDRILALSAENRPA